MEKGQQFVSRLLVFAEFIVWLGSVPAGTNAEFRLHEITERKFRGFWRKRLDLKHDINARRRAVLSDLIEHPGKNTSLKLVSTVGHFVVL